jgi:hypothetical protein
MFPGSLGQSGGRNSPPREKNENADFIGIGIGTGLDRNWYFITIISMTVSLKIFFESTRSVRYFLATYESSPDFTVNYKI